MNWSHPWSLISVTWMCARYWTTGDKEAEDRSDLPSCPLSFREELVAEIRRRVLYAVHTSSAPPHSHGREIKGGEATSDERSLFRVIILSTVGEVPRSQALPASGPQQKRRG